MCKGSKTNQWRIVKTCPWHINVLEKTSFFYSKSWKGRCDFWLRLAMKESFEQKRFFVSFVARVLTLRVRAIAYISTTYNI